MINKSQIMTWRNIGYDAQELICRCDSNASVEKLAEMAEAIEDAPEDVMELINYARGIEEHTQGMSMDSM